MNLIGRAGFSVRSSFDFVIESLGLLSLTLKETRHILNKSKRSIFWLLFKRQLYNSGVKAAYINTLIAVLLGVVLMSKAFSVVPLGAGGADYYGQFFVIVIIRELGPLVSGIILISRSATAIVAEVGHLKLSNEFDALASMRMSPIYVFLVPVFYSFPLSLLLMFFYFNVICVASSYIVIVSFYEPTLEFQPFLQAILNNVSKTEIVIAVAKAVVGGSLIGLISIQFGANVGERFTDISRAISNSTTAQLFMFFALNIMLSLLAYR